MRRHQTMNLLEMAALQVLFEKRPDRFRVDTSGKRAMAVAEYDDVGDVKIQDINLVYGDRCVPLLPYSNLAADCFEYALSIAKKRAFQAVDEMKGYEHESNRNPEQSV